MLLAAATVSTVCLSTANCFGITRRGQPLRSRVDYLVSAVLESSKVACIGSGILLASRYAYRSDAAGKLNRWLRRNCSIRDAPVLAVLVLAALFLATKMRRDLRNFQWMFRIWAARLGFNQQQR